MIMDVDVLWHKPHEGTQNETPAAEFTPQVKFERSRKILQIKCSSAPWAPNMTLLIAYDALKAEIEFQCGLHGCILTDK